MADDNTNGTATAIAPAAGTGIPTDLVRVDPPGEGPGDDYASAWAIGGVSAYLLVMLVTLLYLLIALWPQPTPSMRHSELDRIVSQRNNAQADTNRTVSAPPSVRDTTKADTSGSLAANPDNSATGSSSSARSRTSNPSTSAEDSVVRALAGLRHARMVIPGPGVKGVPGFYRCVPPDSTKLWVVHEDDVIDPQCVKLFGRSIPVSNEVRVLLVVLLSGALGALLYALRSLRWYVGTRYLKQSWLLQYYLFPLIGALLALVTYAVLRGPFFNSGTDVSQTSPISFAAAAFLVGIFNEEAIEKLRDIAKSVFAPKNPGPETAPGARQAGTAGAGTSTDTQLPAEEGDAAVDDAEHVTDPAVLGISQVTLTTPGADGAPTVLEVRGSGFTATTQLEVDGAARQPQFQNGTLVTLALTDAEKAKLAAMGTLEVVAIEADGARSEPVHVP